MNSLEGYSPETCPICGSDMEEDLPQPSLHLATVLYTCGTEMIDVIGMETHCIKKSCKENIR